MRDGLIKLSAVSVAALLVWGVVLETRSIEITELDLNAGTSTPQTIAVIADLHLDGIGTREQKLFTIIRQRQPDTVILLGDVVDSPDDLPELARFLGSLPASERLAVLGNWEYWSGIDRDALLSIYAKYDVHLLVDDCHNGVVGLDDATAGHPSLNLAVARCDSADSGVSPYLLLQHSPGFFESSPVGTRPFSLSLSGHTHGGQIALFGWAPWTPPGSGSFVAGEYTTRLGRLYVTRGMGTSLIPLRIGARAEIVMITTY